MAFYHPSTCSLLICAGIEGATGGSTHAIELWKVDVGRWETMEAFHRVIIFGSPLGKEVNPPYIRFFGPMVVQPSLQNQNLLSQA